MACLGRSLVVDGLVSHIEGIDDAQEVFARLADRGDGRTRRSSRSPMRLSPRRMPPCGNRSRRDWPGDEGRGVPGAGTHRGHGHPGAPGGPRRRARRGTGGQHLRHRPAHHEARALPHPRGHAPRARARGHRPDRRGGCGCPGLRRGRPGERRAERRLRRVRDVPPRAEPAVPDVRRLRHHAERRIRGIHARARRGDRAREPLPRPGCRERRDRRDHGADVLLPARSAQGRALSGRLGADHRRRSHRLLPHRAREARGRPPGDRGQHATAATGHRRAAGRRPPHQRDRAGPA